MAGACGDAADGEDAADPGDGGRDSLVDTSEDADAGDPDATADSGPAYVVPGFDVAAIDFPYCEVDARDIDARLAALRGAEGGAPRRAFAVGGYAVPIDAADLGEPAAAEPRAPEPAPGPRRASNG